MFYFSPEVDSFSSEKETILTELSSLKMILFLLTTLAYIILNILNI